MKGESADYKLFVDDMRQVPKGWFGARTLSDTIKFLHSFSPIAELSLDHDILYPTIGPDKCCYYSAETYMGIAYYIALMPPGMRPKRIRVHSANAGAAQEMCRVMGLDFRTTYNIYNPKEYENED